MSWVAVEITAAEEFPESSCLLVLGLGLASLTVGKMEQSQQLIAQNASGNLF